MSDEPEKTYTRDAPPSDLVKRTRPHIREIEEAAVAPLEELPTDMTIDVPEGALEQVRRVKTAEEATRFAEERFDEDTAAVLVERINAIVDVPYIPESIEGFLFRQVLEAALFAYHKVTS